MKKAGRKSKKGRAIGGMLIGLREGIEVKEEEGYRDREGILVRKVKLGKEWWRVVRVYVNRDIENKMEDMKSWMEKKEEKTKTVIGGD